MFPWVAEVGQDEVIQQIIDNKKKPVMVYIELNTSVWGYPVKTYLKDLITALDKYYILSGENTYISPGLKARCEVIPKVK